MCIHSVVFPRACAPCAGLGPESGCDAASGTRTLLSRRDFRSGLRVSVSVSVSSG